MSHNSIFGSLRFLAILAGVMLAGLSNANAQWYASGHVGGVFLNDSDVTDTFTGGNGTGNAKFDTGFGLAAAAGYSWGNFRAEGEISYRKNDLDELRVDSITVGGILITSLGTFDLGGDIDAWGFMANGWYDVDTGTDWVPFVGAGIGAARLNVDITSVGGVATVYDESDTVFAYQIAAGIGYKVTPKATVSLSYRFFGTTDPEFDDGTEKIEMEYQSHNVMAGVVFRF